jgi:transcriptional regulator with GAF, ATPase, and Fis domain
MGKNFSVIRPTLSGELLESELFGHTKGALKGAGTIPAFISQRNGFLDEIGDLCLA